MTGMLFALLAVAPTFTDPNPKPLQVHERADLTRPGVEVRELVFAGSAGQTIQAYRVKPPGSGPFPAILFVHWLGESKSDRTEFLDEAIGLAKHGAVSLLINAPWSEKGWFEKRTCDGDYQASIRQVIDLRRALDVLLANPAADPKRVAYVGHDFGAMYGALLASVDARPKTFVLMAGTSSFSDWFLLGDPPKDKATYVQQMAELAPTAYVGKTSASVFFQFAGKDKYVPAEKAKAFFEAAHEPKLMRTYDVDHQLNSKDGLSDRTRWLAKELGLKM